MIDSTYLHEAFKVLAFALGLIGGLLLGGDW